MSAEDPINKYGRVVPHRMKGVHYSHSMPTDDCVPKRTFTCVKPTSLPVETITDQCRGVEPPYSRDFRPRRIRLGEDIERRPSK